MFTHSIKFSIQQGPADIDKNDTVSTPNLFEVDLMSSSVLSTAADGGEMFSAKNGNETAADPGPGNTADFSDNSSYSLI